MSKKETGYYAVKADCYNCKTNEQEVKLKKGVNVFEGLKATKCANCGCPELSRHYEKSCGCIHYSYPTFIPTYPRPLSPSWQWGYSSLGQTAGSTVANSIGGISSGVANFSNSVKMLSGSST